MRLRRILLSLQPHARKADRKSGGLARQLDDMRDCGSILERTASRQHQCGLWFPSKALRLHTSHCAEGAEERGVLLFLRGLSENQRNTSLQQKRFFTKSPLVEMLLVLSEQLALYNILVLLR